MDCISEKRISKWQLNKLLNFYEILTVKPSASKNQIFRAFSRKLAAATKEHLGGKDQSQRIGILLLAYFTLEEDNFKKYYNLLSGHLNGTGIKLRPDTEAKYNKVMTVVKSKSEKAATFYLSEPNDLIKKFNAKTRIKVLGDLIMLPISLALNSFGSKTSVAILLSISGLALVGYGLLNNIHWVIGTGASILVTGMYAIRESVTTLQREEFNQVLGLRYNTQYDRYEFADSK
jgi:hypothetical protein